MNKRGIADQDLEESWVCMENCVLYHCTLRLPAHQLDPWNDTLKRIVYWTIAI